MRMQPHSAAVDTASTVGDVEVLHKAQCAMQTCSVVYSATQVTVTPTTSTLTQGCVYLPLLPAVPRTLSNYKATVCMQACPS